MADPLPSLSQTTTPPGREDFGAAYTGWKGWGEQGFAALGTRDRATFTREVARLGQHFQRKSLKVLEIGFGQGAFLSFCRELEWDVVGTEASTELVAVARAAGFDVKDANALHDLPSQTFDLIAGFDVIEHVPQSEMMEFLLHLRRLLKPCGVILLRFPNADSWLGNQNFYGDPTHVTAMGHFKLAYYCGQCGLTMAAFMPEVRLGFDGGLAKGIHAIVAGPIIAGIGWLVKSLYFPRSRMVLTSANVVAHLRVADQGAVVR